MKNSTQLKQFTNANMPDTKEKSPLNGRLSLFTFATREKRVYIPELEEGARVGGGGEDEEG